MRHFWSQEHDAVLRAVVGDMLPYRDALQGPREVWWGAVAAETMRRLGCTDVSPYAARTRWELLSRRRRRPANETTAALARLEHDAELGVLPEMDEVGDAWERTARAVEGWERTIGEETRDRVGEILLDMQGLVSVVEQLVDDVAALRREWEGTR